ncbi:MAG: phosphatidate cytidylyltransferase [Phycisphaerae bacterium]|nr:phosphatidate cytidylyltransferase [Phycisphaerae bacterium]
MVKRIIYGTVMIAAVAGLLALDAWLSGQIDAYAGNRPGVVGVTPLHALPLAVLLLPLLIRATLELVTLAAAGGVAILRLTALTGVMALGTLPFWWQFSGVPLTGGVVLAGVMVLVMVVFAEQMLLRRHLHGLPGVAATVMAIVYLGGGTAVMLQLRLEFGVAALAVFLATVKFADIGAYFAGKAIGRHKLVPSISPGKSWEGLAGAVIFGAVMAVGGTRLLAMLPAAEAPGGMPLIAAAGFGVVMALSGQFADLCESVLKRSAKVKDSGRAVPEFGGILDIIDSPLLAAPVGYILLTVLAR